MIIDPEGLFNGNRWRRCSSQARLNAPYLMLAANGYGRLEIDPLRIIAKAYATFNPRPTEKEILAWIQEYENAHLLFLYEHCGQTWAQWDTPERLLAKYKLAADRRSPEPPEPEYTKWKTDYRAMNHSPSTSSKTLPKSSQKDFKHSPSGVGEGEGEGEGKHICAPRDGAPLADSNVCSDAPLLGDALVEQQAQWFEAWWAIYWLAKSRKRALEAFRQHVRTEDRFQEIMEATNAQSDEMRNRDPRHRPHGASWLNGERWLDEVKAFGALTDLEQEVIDGFK